MLDPAVYRICLSIFPVPLLLGGNFGGILDKSNFCSGFIICWDVWTSCPAGFQYGFQTGLLLQQEKGEEFLL
jgi:hypothetical protein